MSTIGATPGPNHGGVGAGALAPVLLMAAQAGLAATYYVSPAGDDGHTGLGPEPDQALRTVEAGVDRLQAGDTLVLRAGVYRETVTFPRSGEPGRPITVRAYEGERAVVSGCEPITGWTRDEGDVWKAPMPWTLGPGRNQVSADDEVMIEARFPNEAAPGLEMYVSDLSPLWPTFGEFSIPDPTQEPGRIVSKLLEGQPEDHWKGACYYGVHYQGWSAQTGLIESSRSGEIMVGDRTRTWWFPGPYSGYKPEEGRGMIVGHRNALDRRGEWAWEEDTLYLIPRGGGEPRKVEAKRRQLAFDLSGREHIHLSGLAVRAASLRLDGSAYCVVEGCDLAYLSHFTRFYGMGQIEDGRDTIRSGETGIFVGGHDNSFLNCSIRFSAGAGFHLRGYHHTIHNCLIDEIDYTSHYLNAITDAVSDFTEYENFLVGGHVITYNTMRNAGRHFFNFYGNGTSTASRDRAPMDYRATLFAHNHLYNGMLQTRDAGFLTGYYSSGGTLDGLNSQVVYNVMHDCYDIFGMRINALGIVYLDAGTCDVDLHHNLLWAAPGSHQRGLWFNTMCVDINEDDNVFHPEFTRTCAELTAEDFPEGKPFRFGHDFEDPPPLPDWPPIERVRLEAGSCAGHSDWVVQTPGALSGLSDGDWLRFDEVDFGEGWQSVVVRLASDVREMNSDRSARARPRHQKATDPLVLEATENDGLHEGVRKQWTFVYNTAEGSWLRFNQVPLGEGYKRFRVVYGSDTPAPRWVEVHLDSADGPLAGRIALRQTDRPRGGRVQIYDEAVGELSGEAIGTRDVFVVFRSEDGKPAGEFEYFRFEQYRGRIGLQPKEVKLELRLDGTDGEKIGELHPRFTGGPDAARDLVGKLEPATGRHALFVVVRSALDGPVGTVYWLSLEKARQPQEPSGVGLPPRTLDGKMVLPQPTNRPCARPADNYSARTRTEDRPRPLFAAGKLRTAPEIDGRLDDGELTGESVRRMVLAESYDGSPAAAAPSVAWVGYDDEALYIAATHPVQDVGRLRYASHQWGATDAMEVAIQDGFAATPGPILNLYGWPDGHFVSTGQAGAPADVVARLGRAVTYQAVVGADTWTCEWRVPFAACGFTPRTAPMVCLNLGVRKTMEDAWVIWRGTGGATYVVSRAGVLVFSAELMASEAVPREGLEVWLDASDDRTVERDEGRKVVVWRDKSGRSRDARQDSPGFRPLYVPDGLNGRPALRFSEDSRTRMELPDLSDERITATIFAVISNPEAGAEVNHDPRIFTASDGKEHDYVTGLACSIPGMETGGPRQVMATFVERWAKHVRVGCFSPNYQTFLKGYISEILVYGRAMTRDETDEVRAYLMSKWDLQ